MLFQGCSLLGARGFTAVELLLAAAIGVTLVAVAVPMTSHAVDHIRTGMAARYLEARIMDARLQAIRRSAPVGLRFDADGFDYRFADYLDGNGNGIRAAEISAGIDSQLVAGQRLADHFPGVVFGLHANVPDVDGARSTTASDGVRIGTSRILTLDPDGTATSGTLYVRGRRGQFAVRVFGVTGRIRVLRFDPGTQRWIRQ